MLVFCGSAIGDVPHRPPQGRGTAGAIVRAEGTLTTKSYSIRASLQGELHDFLVHSGFKDCTSTHELVRDVTALLAAYREEDVPLYPSVFVLSTIDHVAAISPATERVVVGSIALNAARAATILKDCAPLAENGWSIYVGKVGEPAKFEYGLFRSLANTFATSAEEAMVQEGSELPILVIRNRGRLVVEIRNSRNDTFTASLTSAIATDSHFATHVNDLVEAVTADLETEETAAFAPYLRRFFADTLQRCHGTLCAVVKLPTGHAAPARFARSVWLTEPLRWAIVHAEARLHKSADALARLQAVESLVVGMIHSDGVVVLGSNGTVLGYRAFLSPDDEERKQQEAEGGGRRRTYALMRGRLGGELRAAFFRSQDGDTECERAKQ